MTAPVLEVTRLEVRVAGGPAIVEDVTFSLAAGEVLGVVGESGCGKTTTAVTLLGRERRGTRVTRGSVRVLGTEILELDEVRRRDLRGKVISYVPQEPGTALNPSLRIRDQVREVLRAHAPEHDSDSTASELLTRVGLPGDRGFGRRFPHQLSGGQQQRVTIAAALAAGPAILVLDEPTTGLDVATQALILAEIRRLQRELGVAMVYVSHDLAVVASIADRVLVMYAGKVVEEGPITQVLYSPKHPYTRGLVSSVPDHHSPRRLRGIAGVVVGIGERPPGCAFAPRCGQARPQCRTRAPELEQVAPGHWARCLFWADTPPLTREPPLETKAALGEPVLLSLSGLSAGYRSSAGRTEAVRSVSFAIRPSEAVALVGESGSGKTTIARCIAGLHVDGSGELIFNGQPLPWGAKRRSRELRRMIQIVFQNPYDSLNPRQSVQQQIARPARLLRGLSRSAARREAQAMLAQVRLPAGIADRYPNELSGGERQRVAIARALVARPSLLVCDEITSALDVSVQGAVLDLLAELQAELGLALLVISHDLGVVASVADRVIVLHRGRVREEAATRELLHAPQDEYTKMLLETAPRLSYPESTPGLEG
jgi:peptide/nickel transport system ATP-binding protein